MTVNITCMNKDGNTRPIDSIFHKGTLSGSLVTIDQVHNEIHNGTHYYIEGYTTLANLAVLRVKLVTPNSGKRAHFTWAIYSSGILTTTLHEGASGGMAGVGAVDVTPFNSDRNSNNASEIDITKGVDAATSDGLLISQASWGASGFKAIVGGGSSREDGLTLKKDTTYLRTFTSGADANIVQFKASWYEYGE